MNGAAVDERMGRRSEPEGPQEFDRGVRQRNAQEMLERVMHSKAAGARDDDLHGGVFAVEDEEQEEQEGQHA